MIYIGIRGFRGFSRFLPSWRTLLRALRIHDQGLHLKCLQHSVRERSTLLCRPLNAKQEAAATIFGSINDESLRESGQPCLALPFFSAK